MAVASLRVGACSLPAAQFLPPLPPPPRGAPLVALRVALLSSERVCCSVGLSVTVERARDVFVVFDVLLLLCVFLLLLLLSNMGGVGGEEMLC